jgi:predicted Zn-dependent peptidase
MNEVEEAIVKNSPFTNNKVSTLVFDDHVKHRDVVEDESTGKFEQSMIIYLYSFENLSREQRLYDATILGDVLGSGLNSLLYKDIREKHSLCYNLNAVYMRHSNLLMISVGVDKKNIDKTKERIEYIMSNLNTLINKDNVSDAILNVISGIEQSTDSLDYLLFESDAVFNNIIDPMDVKLNKFKNVTEESVKSILPNMKEYTKYVLVGDKNARN